MPASSSSIEYATSIPERLSARRAPYLTALRHGVRHPFEGHPVLWVYR
jgi:hypothetical protein